MSLCVAGLRFAVSWNRTDLLEAQLSAIPSWQDSRSNLLREVLQHALELERPDMVKAALHHGAPAKEINLLELYRKLADPEQCRFPLFYTEQRHIPHETHHDAGQRSTVDLSPTADDWTGDGRARPDGRRAPGLYYRLFWDGEVKQAAERASILDHWRRTAPGAGAPRVPYSHLPSPPASPPQPQQAPVGGSAPPRGPTGIANGAQRSASSCDVGARRERRPVLRRSAEPPSSSLPTPRLLPQPYGNDPTSGKAAATAAYWRQQQEEQRQFYERQQQQIREQQHGRRQEPEEPGTEVADWQHGHTETGHAHFASEAQPLHRLNDELTSVPSHPYEQPYGTTAVAQTGGGISARNDLSFASRRGNGDRDGDDRPRRDGDGITPPPQRREGKPTLNGRLQWASGAVLPREDGVLPRTPADNRDIPSGGGPGGGDGLRDDYFPADFYPRAVWEFLADIIPDFLTLWEHKMQQKAKKRLESKRKHLEGGMSEHEAAQRATKENKPGIRALDLYVWAVLFGNTELAMVLLGTCADPMRAALLGARICNHMADVLPIESESLEEAARQHEDFAIALLDLCDNQNDAKCMLLSPAVRLPPPCLCGKHATCFEGTAALEGIRACTHSLCAHCMPAAPLGAQRS